MNALHIARRYSFVSHLGGETHYQLIGPKRGEVVVLVPGATLPLAVWEPLLAPLAQAGFRVLRFDLAGRGHSTTLNVKAGLASDCVLLNVLLDHLKIEKPVHLVGLASGAISVATYARQNAKRVGRVAFVAPDGVKTLSFNEKLFVAPVIGEVLTATIAGRIMLKRLLQYSERPDVTSYLTALMTFALQGRFYQKSLLAYVRGMPLKEGNLIYRRLADSGIATCVIAGGADQINPAHTMMPLKEMFGAAAVHILEGVGHLPQLEEPHTVAQLLVQHFNSAHRQDKATA